MAHWNRIDKSDLPAVFSALQEKWDVFAPVERENDFRIRQLPADGEY